LWIACIYIAILSGPPTVKLMKVTEPQVNLLLTFVLSLCFALVLVGFNGFNLYLIATGQTQLEFYGNSSQYEKYKKQGLTFVNPFDLGARKNLQLFFGLNRNWYSFGLLLMPSTRPALGDGINFPTVTDN